MSSEEIHDAPRHAVLRAGCAVFDCTAAVIRSGAMFRIYTSIVLCSTGTKCNVSWLQALADQCKLLEKQLALVGPPGSRPTLPSTQVAAEPGMSAAEAVEVPISALQPLAEPSSVPVRFAAAPLLPQWKAHSHSCW